MLALIITLFIETQAQADAYEQLVYNWPVKITTPTLDHYGSAVLLGKCKPTGIYTCPHHGESISINSNNQYVKCHLFYDSETDTDMYFMEFSATSNNFPITWPNSFTCTATEGSNTVTSTVLLVDAPDSNGPGTVPSLLSLTTGWSITLEKNNYARQTADWADFTLPAGNYTTGIVNCKRQNNSIWAGVSVSIKENSGSTDRARARVGPVAIDGTGYCPIIKDGVTYNVPATVVKQLF